jgi:cell division protein YceG involved in septum cleavage
LFTANIQVDREDEDLYIPNQASYTTVLDSLAKKKSIQDILSFRFLAKVLGYPSRIHPGRYVLRKNSSNLSVILKLRSGKQDPVKVTLIRSVQKKILQVKFVNTSKWILWIFSRYLLVRRLCRNMDLIQLLYYVCLFLIPIISIGI